MRNGGLVVTLVALGSTASAACGGSSSETPFPIEPNQAELRSGMLTQARYLPVTRRRDAGRRSSEEGDEESTEPVPEPSEATEGTRGADEEPIKDTQAPGGTTSDPRPGDADAGAAPSTWGEQRAPKR